MSEKYSFIAAEKARHTIVRLCSALRVSRSGYYEWASPKTSLRAVENTELTRKLVDAHRASRGRYGDLGFTERSGETRWLAGAAPSV